MKSLGVSEGEGLRLAEKENIEVRAAAKVAAAQAVAGQQIHETPGLSSASNISSGKSPDAQRVHGIEHRAHSNEVILIGF